MLTIQQFSLFNTKARYDITTGLGIYISTRHFCKAEVALYSLYNFVVEVWKTRPADALIKVEALPELRQDKNAWPFDVCLN